MPHCPSSALVDLWGAMPHATLQVKDVAPQAGHDLGRAALLLLELGLFSPRFLFFSFFFLRQGLAVLSRLEYSGVISVHCNLRVLG